jgi:hypothetical protein
LECPSLAVKPLIENRRNGNAKHVAQKIFSYFSVTEGLIGWVSPGDFTQHTAYRMPTPRARDGVGHPVTRQFLASNSTRVKPVSARLVAHFLLKIVIRFFLKIKRTINYFIGLFPQFKERNRNDMLTSDS